MDEKTIGAEEIYLAPEMTDSEGASLMSEGLSGETTQEGAPFKTDEKPKENFRVGEILDLRKSNGKVYRMSDGSEQAVFYPETIHVFHPDTQTFDDVENTLIEDKNGKQFISGKNHFVARFSREEDNDELFSVESGMHRVTVSSKKNMKQRNKGVRPKIRKKAAAGFEETDTLVFEGVQDGSDYEYSVTGNGVKEAIVVKKKSDVYRYSFVLDSENVTAQFDEEHKRISFISDENGEEVFFIPSPFMQDANGVVSTDVSYELKPSANGRLLFTVTADSKFLNAEERAFPVVIDPQIQIAGSTAMTTYSWANGYLYNAPLHTVGTTGNGDGPCNSQRMYLSVNMPLLPVNSRIKKAQLVFTQHSMTSDWDAYPKFGLYRIDDVLSTGPCTPVADSNLIDYARMRSKSGTAYTFDITTLMDQVDKGEIHTQNLVLKMLDEGNVCNNSITFYSSTCGNASVAPKLIIDYESTYGVNTSYRTHTHELGRFGRGSLDLQCGNLMFESEDFAWSGNRMPVTIKHLYNSALSNDPYTANASIRLQTADFSAMHLGYGFKLNVMQSMTYLSTLPLAQPYDESKNTPNDGYVYIGENGEEVYFKQSDKKGCCEDNSACYPLYEGVNDSDMLYDPVKRTLQQGEETYRFDASGRLIQIQDAAGNHMDITYTSNRITSVSDGAGRDFGFDYSNGFLHSIEAPDGTRVLYDYTGNLLSTVTYPDGKKATITYSANQPVSVTLLDAAGLPVYKVAYSYTGRRLTSVTEYGVENGSFVMGAQSTYAYSAASGKTTVETVEPMDEAEGESTDNVLKTVYTFDDDGNIVSEYVYSKDTGNTGVEGEESGIHPHSGEGGAGIVSNINNLLINHSFENADHWSSMPGNSNDFAVKPYTNESYAKFGAGAVRMSFSKQDDAVNGIYQDTALLPAGNYTFSVYVRLRNTISFIRPGVFIRVTDSENHVLAESEHLTAYSSEYIRLIAPFEILSAQSVRVQVLLRGRGTADVDAAQLENNPYANAYNLLENGNFERDSGWSLGSGVWYTDGTHFNMSRSLMMVGNVDADRYARQEVAVKKSCATRETFTLSGWAKGYGLPDHERDGSPAPTFRLRAEIKYKDVEQTESHTADFSPCTEEWQLASVQFAKKKYAPIESVAVYCEYGYNFGHAFFDDIQLVRNGIETNLSADDFTADSENAGSNTAAEDKSPASDTAPSFSEAKDRFGNALTETTFTDGEFGTIYRSFGFTPDCNGAENAGNDLVCETDARGNATTYEVNGDTSRNAEVTDRCGNKTAYEYDAAGKTTRVTSKKADGTEMATVSYAYDAFDNMTEIARGDGMKYVLAYNAFHNLESIGVDGKTDGELVQYTYKNGNGRLKQITYANGDTMKATYNSAGQMIAEKWFDKDGLPTVPKAYYKYVYDGQGNIVRSVDILNEVEYNYQYEEGRLLRATECRITVGEDGIVTSKTLVNTVFYTYGDENKLTRKRIVPAEGSEWIVYYDSSDDNTVVKFEVPAPTTTNRYKKQTVTFHSKTDSFGRKVFDELQLGKGFVSRQFDYHAGQETREHLQNDKLKSSPTTQLVSRILLSGGRTLSYEYDAEERITKVTDSVDGVTEYTYDALGQLLTETHDGVVVNSMTYDNYGNIRTKNGVAYAYGDAGWKDLLTGVGDQTVAYDAQGNPTSYLGHALSWEKGRQLKSFDSNTYTYNANGIRTSKTVGGVKHTYTLDGTKILRETWDGNTLIPLYDNEDSVCGILYNEVAYYFHKNLQGDVIAIVDKNAEVVARYSYDAWGACTVVQDSTECGIANINPYRYRGYYFDEEIGLYYLQSRYYDPSVGRFLNSDDSEYTINQYGSKEHDLFTYCNNDPINYIDPFGNIALITCVIIGAVAGLILGGATGACISYAKYKKVKWKYVLIGAGVGAAIGAAAGYAIGVAIGASSTTIFAAKGFAKTFRITAKISKQMARRGWSESLIRDTILKNVGRKAINKATRNAATAYFTSTGAYVVIDNITKEIIQISDRFDPKWVVDVTIQLLKSDVFVR